MVGSVANGSGALLHVNGKVKPPPEVIKPEVASSRIQNGVGEDGGEGEERKKRTIVLGRNVRASSLEITEPDVDDEVTGDREAFMASVLAKFRRSLVERTNHFLGTRAVSSLG